MNFKKHLFASFGLGLISAVCFMPIGAVWAMLFLFPVWFAFINKAQTKKALFELGFCFGAGMGAASMFWLTQALLIDNGAFAWALPIIPIGFGLLFGIFWGIPALLCYWSRPGFSRLAMLAGAITLFEWIRSWILTGFPWNLLGSIWTAVPSVLQTASWFGVYGLTLFSLFWFAAPFFLFTRQYKTFGGIVLSFLIVFGGGYWRLAEAHKETVWGVQLRLVQPNIPQTLKWNPQKAEENLMKHIRLSKKEGQKKISHVLWAEAAVPYLLEQDEEARAMTISAVSQGGTLITGALRIADKDQRLLSNSILILNDVGQIKGHYDKSHLVPFGEYVPLRGLLPFDKVVPIASDFKAGDGVLTHAILNAPPAGLLVCYEIIFPGQVVDPKHRPEWLINVTNDGWYGNSAGPYQHLAAAQLRAVEEGLPIARVAGSGISALIDPYGRILKSLPLQTEGVLDTPLPRALNETIYGRFGNGLPLFLAALCLCFGFRIPQKKKE